MNEHDLSVPVRTSGQHGWRWIVGQFVFEQLGWVVIRERFRVRLARPFEYPSKILHCEGEKTDNEG